MYHNTFMPNYYGPEDQAEQWRANGMDAQFAFVDPESPVAGKLLDLILLAPAAGQVWRAIDPDEAETRDDLSLQDQIGDARYELASFLVKSVWNGVRQDQESYDEIVDRVRIESIRFQRDMMLAPIEVGQVLKDTRAQVCELLGDDPEDTFRLARAA
jgi:hypothetical protein